MKLLTTKILLNLQEGIRQKEEMDNVKLGNIYLSDSTRFFYLYFFFSFSMENRLSRLSLTVAE